MHRQGIEEHLKGYPEPSPKSLDQTEKCPLPARAGFYKTCAILYQHCATLHQYRATFLKKEGDTFKDWAILLSKARDTFRISYDSSYKEVRYWKVSHDISLKGMQYIPVSYDIVSMGVRYIFMSHHADTRSPQKREKTTKEENRNKLSKNLHTREYRIHIESRNKHSSA